MINTLDKFDREYASTIVRRATALSFFSDSTEKLIISDFQENERYTYRDIFEKMIYFAVSEFEVFDISTLYEEFDCSTEEVKNILEDFMQKKTPIKLERTYVENKLEELKVRIKKSCEKDQFRANEAIKRFNYWLERGWIEVLVERQKVIKFRKVGKGASEEEIRKLENFVGKKIPKEYADFLRQNNGAELEGNSLDDKMDMAVRDFYSVDEIIEDYKLVGLTRLKKNKMPIAHDSCGNLFQIDLISGEIFFWDHEYEADDDDYEAELIAKSFNDFLSRLEKDVTDLSELPKGKVTYKSPDFEEEFKEYLIKK